MAFYPDAKTKPGKKTSKQKSTEEDALCHCVRLTCLFVCLFVYVHYYYCDYYYCYQYHDREISEIGFSIRIQCHSTHDSFERRLYIYVVQM